MLVVPSSARNPSSRKVRFLQPLWHDDHPDFLRIDSALPPDHHARWLASVVSRLDLTAFRLSYKGYGSLAYPVEFLLAFVLFMYSRAILCPAQWADHARYDDQSKWLLRGLRPSRSLLYVFRDRCEPFLDELHKQLLAWAIAEGVTSASRGSLDGTFVAALASRHQLMSCRRLDRRLLLLRLLVWLEHGHAEGHLASQLDRLPELVLVAVCLSWLGLSCGVQTSGLPDTLLGLLCLLELLWPEGAQTWPPRLPAWVPATPKGRQRVLRRYEEAQQRLARRLKPLLDKKKPSKKDEQTLKRAKVSLTDPEAALGWDKLGTYRPLYNLALVQATDAPLTLAFDVLSRNNDDGLLRPMMEKTKEQLGCHLEEALVDGAFVCVLDVAWCEKEGITVYAPPARAEAAEGEAVKAEGTAAEERKGAEKVKAKKQQKLPKSAFRYDKEEKVYHCPQGKRLEEAYRTTAARSGGMELPVIVHRASGEDCQECPKQKECTSGKQGRTVKRYEGEEALERLEGRMAEAQNKEVYKLRGQSVELGYADVKEHRGLRVFRCFGRKRARAQAGLVILASNGLKLMRILQRRQETPHHPPSRDKLSA
jgi:transposase